MNLHRLSILLLSLIFISSFAQKVPKKSGWKKFKSFFKHEVEKNQNNQNDVFEEHEQVVDQDKLGQIILGNDEVALELEDAIQQEQIVLVDQQKELEVVEEVELDESDCETNKTDELQEVCNELIVDNKDIVTHVHVAQNNQNQQSYQQIQEIVTYLEQKRIKQERKKRDSNIYFAWLKSKKRWFMATGLVVISGIGYNYNGHLVLLKWLCKSVDFLDGILNKEKRKEIEDQLEFLQKDTGQKEQLKRENQFIKENLQSIKNDLQSVKDEKRTLILEKEILEGEKENEILNLELNKKLLEGRLEDKITSIKEQRDDKASRIADLKDQIVYFKELVDKKEKRASKHTDLADDIIREQLDLSNEMVKQKNDASKKWL